MGVGFRADVFVCVALSYELLAKCSPRSQSLMRSAKRKVCVCVGWCSDDFMPLVEGEGEGEGGVSGFLAKIGHAPGGMV